MVHDAAAAGYDRGAASYQRARPTYHSALVDRFADRYGTGRIVEIGAGTGIFTGQLVERGLDVVAVEPVEGMRVTLAARFPGLDVRAGTAEDLPVADSSADVVVVAQAFHWFDHRPALDDIHRALAPGGRLVTVWNVKVDGPPWYAAYTSIVERHAGDTPRHADMAWRHAIEADPRFEPIDDWTVDNPFPTDEQGIVDRALSTSFIAALPETQQAAVVADIRAALATAGGDRPLRFPYRSELQAWRAAGDGGRPGSLSLGSL